MKNLTKLIFIYTLLLTPAHAFAQSKFQVIRSKWSEKKYKEVIVLGKAYRNTLNGKGIPALDYMILSSICLTSSDRVKTCKKVKSIVESYYRAMDPVEQQVMKRGFDKVCETGNVELNLLANNLNSRQSAQGQNGGFRGQFKTFMLISESLENEGIFKDMSASLFSEIYANRNREIAEIQSIDNDSKISRLNERVSKNDEGAVKKRLERFGNNATYIKSENFIVIADRSTELNLKTVSKNLEEVLAYYQRLFKMSVPQDYIIVNLIKDYNAVRPFISRYYKSKITFEPLGYSSPEDNTIIAWIAASDMIGTLKHELVHLLMRSTFSFIPPWFEEGLASLYEESRFSGDTLKGIGNWRGPILKEKFINFPVDSMVTDANYVFTSAQRDSMKFRFTNYIIRGSSRVGHLRQLYAEHKNELGPILDVFLQNYLTQYKNALSRYFVMYMQETGRLQAFYALLLKRDQVILDMEEIKTDQELLCESFNRQDSKMIYDDFYTWLNRL